MATTYKTPGVYIEEIPKFPPSVAQVETAIPAFIGYTEKAKKLVDDDLHLAPTRLTSLLEFENFFGKAQNEAEITVTMEETQEKISATETKISLVKAVAAGTGNRSKHNMYYSMQMYFANGGGPCYIVSVGKFKGAFGANLVMSELKAGLDEIAKFDEPTLIVFPEGQNMASNSDYYSLQNDSLTQCFNLQDRFSIIDVYDNSDDSTSVTMETFRAESLDLQKAKYGAAYYPNLKTILNYSYNDADVDVSHIITTVDKMVTPNTTVKAAAVSTTMSAFDINTLQYNSCIDAIRKKTVELPPSSSIAGVYARVDSSRGVWKAPANVSLNYVMGLTDLITDEEQGGMNVDVTAGKSVNAIRGFTGKGILVWGARTLAGNDNEWRYVPVRRFFNMVEESSKKASAGFVFEPNDSNTWVKVQGMLENFLTTLWRQGALQGAKPEHAFYVAVGLNTTMTAFDILEGRMIVEIGLAVVRPAEFIILRFSHKMAES